MDRAPKNTRKEGRPVKGLRRKLHSQSGASILLALLLFLVCAMVAASILAAAVSNAGKARSNWVEQQKYLTLSSAIRLVADEIQKAEYMGKYTVYEWTVPAVIDPTDGHVITPAKNYFYVEQIAGEYSCGEKRGAAKGELTDQIPLGDGLDKIFSKQFTGAGYQPLYNAAAAAGPTECTLTVTLPADLKGYPYEASPGLPAYKVSDTVTVKVRLDHTTRHITLTAWLGNGTVPDDGSDTMIGELVARITEKVPAVPPAAEETTKLVSGTLTVDYNPGDREPSNRGSALAAGASPSSKSAAGAPMQWELNWIKKGDAG